MGNKTDRKKALGKARKIVVKVGSALLTREIEGEGRFLDFIVFELIARQIDSLLADKKDVLIVSSGAMAAGAMRLGRGALPEKVTEKQAWAALGQPQLMQHYEQAFKPYGRVVAQVLLTHEDLEDRRRYINARRTLNLLTELGTVPVVNENDVIASEEIRVGDNDTLSAQVASLVGADLLIILTVVEGLMKDGEVIDTVEKIDSEITALSGGPGSSVGIGGMGTKLEAARMAGAMGIPTVIACGQKPGILEKILGGEKVGTLFLPSGERVSKRKHWIAWAHKPRGTLVVDDGARKAVIKKGKSLLPKGILEIKGKFQRGEAVSVAGADGKEFARGLVIYSSDEMAKIIGLHSNKIEETLGYKIDNEAIHRDDLTLMDSECPE